MCRESIKPRGFTDIGSSIMSVSFNAAIGTVAFDDMRFGRLGSNSVPEPDALV